MLSWVRRSTPGRPPDRGCLRHDGKIDRLNLLQRLVAAMPATGNWSSQTSSDRGKDIVLVVFEKEVDAVRLGDTLRVMRSVANTGRQSQRMFGFPLEVARKIEKVLA